MSTITVVFPWWYFWALGSMVVLIIAIPVAVFLFELATEWVEKNRPRRVNGPFGSSRIVYPGEDGYPK